MLGLPQIQPRFKEKRYRSVDYFASIANYLAVQEEGWGILPPAFSTKCRSPAEGI